MRVVVDNGPGKKRKAPATRGLKAAEPSITLRAAVAADAPQLHALIASHLEEGRLLPRALAELASHAPRFVVAVERSGGDRPSLSAEAPGAKEEGVSNDRIVGCAELAPLSSSVAEVRSLVVGRKARRKGLGQRMIDELGRHARQNGFGRICAFAHDPKFFMRLGFSIVPHTWVPEKIARDCHSCALFRNCGQYAVVFDLHARTSVGTLVRTSVGSRV